ncbi:hypothetical protein T439DRAFT_356557 [Meredithblackwellia eburnea MCA 4105]
MRSLQEFLRRSRSPSALINIDDVLSCPASGGLLRTYWTNEAWKQNWLNSPIHPDYDLMDDAGEEEEAEAASLAATLCPFRFLPSVEVDQLTARLVLEWETKHDGKRDQMGENGRENAQPVLITGVHPSSTKDSDDDDVEDPAIEITLPSCFFTATILRGDKTVVLTFPPPPPRNLPTRRASMVPVIPSFLAPFSETEMGRRIAEFPWETTALGPITTWPLPLRVALASCLASPFRTYVTWNNVFLYNDAYILTAMSKHPRVLGMTVAQAWPEVWDAISAVIESCMRGEVVQGTNHDLPVVRNGLLQESFHTYAFTPIRNEDGKCQGVTCISFETTAEVVTDRRMATVQDLVQKSSAARTVDEFCTSTLECLASNPYDLPFVSLYTTELVDVKVTKRKGWAVPEQSVGRVAVKLTCRGSVGVPEDHPFHISEAQVELSQNTDSDSTSRTPTTTFSWPFEQACRQTEPILLDQEEIDVYTSTLPPRAWGTNPRQVVVYPVWIDGERTFPSAVLVFGVNPRTRYGPEIRTFLEVVTHHLGIGLLAVMNAEADSKRAAELLQLDRAKTNFFSSTSHELRQVFDYFQKPSRILMVLPTYRTPLTLIIGPLEDLLHSTLPREFRDKLEMVTRNANRLLSIVNKLLDFSALQGGRTKQIYSPVHLGPFTIELASLFRDAVERAGLRFDVECEDDPPNSTPTYIARDLYRSIVFNILGNSLKYTVGGGIAVRLRSTFAEVVLEVEDSGIGIPEDELELIFERFHRVAGANGTASGTGIGLALTSEIVKTLGGELEVKSTVGMGSTFLVKFRRGYTHLPSDSVTHTELTENAEIAQAADRLYETEIKDAATYRLDTAPLVSAGTSSESVGGSSGEYFSSMDAALNVKDSTVLLVEDSTDLRTYMSSLLRKYYHVVEFDDGQSALDFALHNPPSLVLTDLMLPQLSGEELLSALRSNPRTALVPVIFVSAAAGPEARAHALERGCDDYLVKPFQSRELLARVRVHLTLGKMRTELESRVAERTAELHNSELRYSLMTQVVPVGIFQMNVNPIWHEITGHPIDRPLSNWEESVDPEDLPMLLVLRDEIKAGRERGSIQFRYKVGTWVQLEFRAVSEFGPSVAYIGTVTDITEQKKLEQMHLRAVENRAADADAHRRQIENFIDITSHELRNPLSGVWQNAEMVSRSLNDIISSIGEMQAGRFPDSAGLEDLAEEMRDNLEGLSNILLCTTHQQRIADDILNVSKLGMGLLTINRVTFNIIDKLREVLAMFEIECSSKGVSLSLDVDQSVESLDGSIIVADPSRLSQVVLNFLLNGVKFTPNGGSITVKAVASLTPPPRRPSGIRVGHIEAENTASYTSPVWITVSVDDSGKGLTEEEMQKLFARFVQVNPRTDQYGGSGLGLFIAKQLVQLHHGVIEVDSTPGVGSSFRFSIPAERGDSEAVVASNSRRPSLAERRTSSTLADARRKNRRAPSEGASTSQAVSSLTLAESTRPLHILVVEDNDINVKVLKRQLTSHGYIVSVAENGQVALDLLEKATADPSANNAISGVLMDIEMPVMGGLEAIRKLRAREAANHAEYTYGVICVTGNARDEQIRECLSSGFNDIAVKPYNFRQLLKQIEQITNRDPRTPPSRSEMERFTSNGSSKRPRPSA